MLETAVLLHFNIFYLFIGTCDTFLGSLINKKYEEQHLFKIEMFPNNINLYYHCFYQFNNPC